MNKIEIYTKYYCPFCTRAKSLLDSMGIKYTEYQVAFDAEKEREMVARSYRTTVPQIFVNGQSIGGSDELAELVDRGVFESLIGIESNQPLINNSNPEEMRHAA